MKNWNWERLKSLKICIGGLTDNPMQEGERAVLYCPCGEARWARGIPSEWGGVVAEFSPHLKVSFE